jgi:MFS family permease
MSSSRQKPGGDWSLVFFLWFAFFLNHADRQIFAVLLPLIKNDLQLTNTEIGLVATTFSLVFGLVVLITGVIGDFVDRGKMVVISLLVLSVGTLLTGLSSSLVLLILFRGIATGAGEALYLPSAAALIAETHNETRSRAATIHQTANHAGIVIGSLFAGWIGEMLGWRYAFIAFGAAGLAWAAIFYLKVRSRPRVLRDPVTWSAYSRSIKSAGVLIFSSPPLLTQTIAFSGLVFSYVGFLTWAPTYLVERYDLSLASAGFSAVFYHVLFASIALIITGIVSDRVVPKWPRFRIVSMSLGLILCAPFLWVIPDVQSFTAMMVVLGAYGYARGTYDANLWLAIFDEVDDSARAAVFGVVIAIAFFVGAVSPVILGMLKDAYGLDIGFRVLAVGALLPGVLLLASTYFIKGERHLRPS